MNAAVPCVISAYQHNLVSDLVTANVRDLFIQVHWGSWGKSPCSTGPYSPPFHCDLALCLYAHNQGTAWLMILLVVPLTTSGDSTQKRSPLSHEHPSGNIWPFAVCLKHREAGTFWIFICLTCLPQTRHCPEFKNKGSCNGATPFGGIFHTLS